MRYASFDVVSGWRIAQVRPYSPATDFYKGLREAIIEIVEHGDDKNKINAAVLMATPKRRGHYREAADGFMRWMGRKNVEWFQPPKSVYGNGNILVSVNPEIGANINGNPHLIKLYFKADKLPKNHALISTHLMQSCFANDCPSGTVMAVLDVKHGNLIEYSTPNDKLDAALRGELAYIESLWENV